MTDGMTLRGLGYSREYGIGRRTGYSRLRGNDVMWVAYGVMWDGNVRIGPRPVPTTHNTPRHPRNTPTLSTQHPTPSAQHPHVIPA